MPRLPADQPGVLAHGHAPHHGPVSAWRASARHGKMVEGVAKGMCAYMNAETVCVCVCVCVLVELFAAIRHFFSVQHARVARMASQVVGWEHVVFLVLAAKTKTDQKTRSKKDQKIINNNERKQANLHSWM